MKTILFIYFIGGGGHFWMFHAICNTFWHPAPIFLQILFLFFIFGCFMIFTTLFSTQVSIIFLHQKKNKRKEKNSSSYVFLHNCFYFCWTCLLKRAASTLISTLVEFSCCVGGGGGWGRPELNFSGWRL